MERGVDRECVPKPAKSLFIADSPEQEESSKREFAAEGMELNFIGGSQYLWVYLGPWEELEAWVKSQVEAWSHGVRVLGKISKRHPQSAYDGLGMPLQLDWNYLQRNVPIVGTLMSPIEEALRETFFPALFGGEEIDTDFSKILGHSVNRGGLFILGSWLSAESAYNTSKAASGELLGSLS